MPMKQLSESVKTQADEELTQRLLSYQLSGGKDPATYLSFEHEVSTAGLIEVSFNLENAPEVPVPIHTDRWNLWNTILIF